MADEIKVDESKVAEGKAMDGMLDISDPSVVDETKVEGNLESEVKPEVEPEVKSKVEDEDKAKEEKPVEVSPDLTKIQEENQKLREQLNELARQTGLKSPDKVEGETEPEIKKELKEGLVQFISDDEAEALLDDPKKLNEFLNRVFQAGREKVMLEMPRLVRQQTLSEISLQQLTTKFWTENKDLESYKDFVGMTANQIEVSNPSWSYDKIFDETAKVARERLNLPVSGEEKPKEELKEGEDVDLKPALPTKRGARTLVEEPATTPDVKELNDLFNFAGN